MADTDETPNLGLYTRGPLNTSTYFASDGRELGRGYDFDLNMRAIDSAFTALQEQVAGIEISGVPPVIDGGTF